MFQSMKQWKETQNSIEKYIHKHVKEKRLEHIYRVKDTAMELFTTHQNAGLYIVEDTEAYKVKIMAAALLHDCAKNIKDEKKEKLVDKYHIQLTEQEKDNIDLAHAKIGGSIAYHKFHIHDHEVIQAIKFHTTGRPDMSYLEKLIFIADYIEPGRRYHEGLESVRELAMTNLDKAVLRALELTINYLHNEGKFIDETSYSAYHYYKDLFLPLKE